MSAWVVRVEYGGSSAYLFHDVGFGAVGAAACEARAKRQCGEDGYEMDCESVFRVLAFGEAWG